VFKFDKFFYSAPALVGPDLQPFL